MIKNRLLRLKERIESEKLDGFIVSGSVRYFGINSGLLVVPLDGSPVLLSSKVELEEVKKGPVKDIRVYVRCQQLAGKEEKVSVGLLNLLASTLKELGMRRVGFEHLPFEWVRKIGTDFECVELPRLMREIRAVKFREEVELLRKAAQLAVKGMRTALEVIEPGRTEREVAAEAEYTMRKAGSDGTPFPTIVASGRNSCVPHMRATDKVLRKGEHVVIDLGAIYQGYASDMTRTVVVGKEESGLIKKVREVQEKVRKSTREGMKASELDGLARRELGKDSVYFVHGLGHGVGLEIHELPSLSPDSEDVLREGMVVTIEPGIYIPDKYGARWEDMFLVRKRDCECLTVMR